MTIPRRIWTIQIEVVAPITVGGRDVMDATQKAIELAVNEDHVYYRKHGRRQLPDKMGTWDFGNAKSVSMRMDDDGKGLYDEVVDVRAIAATKEES